MKVTEHRRRILFAEDDDLLASLLNFRMERSGYNVIHAKNGKIVKEYLSKSMPDVIVSDIMMPYFSGIELIDYVRNVLKSSIPIIMISSAGNEENVLNAFKLGANDFISKPVSPSELLVRIGKALNN